MGMIPTTTSAHRLAAVTVLAALAIGLATALGAVAAPAAPDISQAARTFQAFKDLAGRWQATDDGGHAVTASYEVVARGSAVLERYQRPGEDGSPVTMITLYHLDGEDLMLTHYCMAGNQPRMRAAELDESSVRFELLDATGLTSPGAGHMHRAVFRFQGEDRFTTEWTWNEGGEDTYVNGATFHRVDATPAPASR